MLELSPYIVNSTPRVTKKMFFFHSTNVRPLSHSGTRLQHEYAIYDKGLEVKRFSPFDSSLANVSYRLSRGTTA